MRADDEKHGTTAGYYRGCRQDCCRRARNAYESRRHKQAEALGLRRQTNATGTQRRIRALMAIGWPAQEIAERCGYSAKESILDLLYERKFVYTRTAARIAGVYNELSMTPGPSNVARSRAAAKGWPVPLMWDDIDNDPEPATGEAVDVDPVVVMRILSGDVVPSTQAERVEVARRWIADGRPARELAALTGWKVERYVLVREVAA